MKRKDLKPGTVFSYVNGSRLARYVVGNEKHSQQPYFNNIASELHPSLESEVDVLWVPSTPHEPANCCIEYRSAGTPYWTRLGSTPVMTRTQAEVEVKRRTALLNTPMNRFDYRIVEQSPRGSDFATLVQKSAPLPLTPPREIKVAVRGSGRPQFEAMSDADIEYLAGAAAEKTRRDLRKREADEAKARESRQEYLRKCSAAIQGLCNFLAGVVQATTARAVLRWYAGHPPIGRGAGRGDAWQPWEISDAGFDLFNAFGLRAPWLDPLADSSKTVASLSTIKAISLLQQRRRPAGQARSWGTGWPNPAKAVHPYDRW